MESNIKEYLTGLEFGDIRQFKEVSVIPIFSDAKSSLNYLTSDLAIKTGIFTITEVSKGGSVPDLMVVNTADLPVLLLDGEELVGAKQNRVLNTSILIKEHSETVIPVSCCEGGRWLYNADKFAASEQVMPTFMRYKRMRTVNESLRETKTYKSDQGMVWDDIADVSNRAGVNSSTGAMKDVFEAKKSRLDQYLQAFTYQDGQVGMFVFMNGKELGFDIVSLSSAYKTLHDKLVRSYTLDISPSSNPEIPSKDKALTFLARCQAIEGNKFDSVGHGAEYRYENQHVVGSALVYQEQVVHMAFFLTDGGESTTRIAGFQNRLRNRTR